MDITVDATGELYEKIGPQFKERAAYFNFVVLATNKGEIVGYGAYDFLKNPQGETILYESAKMVRKKDQKKGVGKKITKLSVSYTSPNMAAVRTQNPAEAVSFKKGVGGGTYYSIDRYYEGHIADTLENLRRISGPSPELLDTSSGLCMGIYEERFGDFTADISDPDTQSMVNAFKRVGVNAERGDGLFIVVKLK